MSKKNNFTHSAQLNCKNYIEMETNFHGFRWRKNNNFGTEKKITRLRSEKKKELPDTNPPTIDDGLTPLPYAINWSTLKSNVNQVTSRMQYTASHAKKTVTKPTLRRGNSTKGSRCSQQQNSHQSNPQNLTGHWMEVGNNGPCSGP